MLRLFAVAITHVFDDHSTGAKTSRVWIWIYIALVVALSGLSAWHWWSDGAVRAWAFVKNALVFAIWIPLLWIGIKAKFQRRYDLLPLMLVLLALVVLFHQFVLPLEFGR